VLLLPSGRQTSHSSGKRNQNVHFKRSGSRFFHFHVPVSIAVTDDRVHRERDQTAGGKLVLFGKVERTGPGQSSDGAKKRKEKQSVRPDMIPHEQNQSILPGTVASGF